MHCVRKVFKDVAKSIKNKDPYDPHSGPLECSERGRKVKFLLGERIPSPFVLFTGTFGGVFITGIEGCVVGVDEGMGGADDRRTTSA